MSLRGRDREAPKRRRLLTGLILCLVCLSFAQKQAEASEGFCQEELIRDAYERHNNTEPFENRCTADKYVLMEQQLKDLVKLRVNKKQPLTEACMDHIKNFLCLQCSSSKASGKPGSWSLCDSKCQGCKLLPLLVPQTSNMYKVCC